MRSFFATLRQLVLPAGALPGSPAIILGPDIPAELVAWGLLNNVVFSAVEIFRVAANTYSFKAAGAFGALPAYFEGTYDTTNGVIITSRTVIAGAGQLQINLSMSINPFPIDYVINNAVVQITGPGGALTIGTTTDHPAFNIDGKSAARGLLPGPSRIDSAAGTGNQTVEAIVATMPTVTIRQGRAYSLVAGGGLLVWSAAATLNLRVRLTNLAGATYARWSWVTTAAGQEPLITLAYIRHDAADAAVDLVLTLEATAGNVSINAAANVVRFFELRDVGANTDYVNAFVG